MKKEYFHRNYLYEPKWFDTSQEIKENMKNGQMFYNFYQRMI